MANVLDGEFTRRSLIRKGGAVGALALAPGILAACGGSTETSATTATTGDVGGDLRLVTWQGYDLPDGMKPWRQDNDVKVRTSYIATHDDIQAKVKQSQPGSFDLTTYYQGYGDLYRDLEIISPLDRSAVPSYENNFPELRGTPGGQEFWEADDELWGVPFTFGSYGLNYDAGAISEPKSWRDLLRSEYKDRIAVFDDPQGAILVGALILDLPTPKLTPDQLEQVIELWREFRANARTIAPSPGDVANLFASGEIVAAAPGYSGITAYGRDQGVDMGFAIPSEGSASFSDAWAIVPGSENSATDYSWIEQALTPEVQKYAAESLAGGVSQPDAVGKLNKATRELFPYDDLAGWFEKAPLYNLPPSDEEGITSFNDWLEAWTDFKSESA